MDRAKRLQEDRLEAVRQVATARQHVTQVRAKYEEELRAAEQDDAAAYAAARAAGWSVSELKKIGYAEPAAPARTRRRTPRTPGENSTE